MENKEGGLLAPSKALMLLNVPSGGLSTHNKQAHAIKIKKIGVPPYFDGTRKPTVKQASHTRQ